jgi:hypothetical protein
MRAKHHVCSDCNHILIPIRYNFPNGLSGLICGRYWSEDIFPYETKRDKSEHEAILKYKLELLTVYRGERLGPDPGSEI